MGVLPDRREAAAPAVVGSLSRRELEVLTLLSKMLTTEEIATEMYLSVNTVKTHLRNIYRKLAVTRRGEAVRRARRYRLL
ncbi:response regulator transcription factor [Actinomadura geliboluensis]|uniref:Response regulator transcription factor n=2 Tax=Actinomadura geliboluensis TaxID=882440 RepID=A0A5S4HB58_9ACTN|nr:LuxR C-terminal-related transcriptional regulator [Actinomadura geliboluensis]TMR42495.1 response regulator transcription factor [Actinomadura geliboluensis]